MRRCPPLVLPLAVLLASAVLAGAQIPEKFTNLQVLPKDTTRGPLVQTMRGFASALGVRCQHCHVGRNPEDLATFDFASDEKEPKKVARAMMRMTQEINTRLLPASGRETVMSVQCITCHRGVKKPEQLADILGQRAREGGVDAALQTYGELREKYYGRQAYDFGAPTLNILAERLAAEKNLGDAIAVQEFNLKVNPNLANSYSLLANLYEQKGDRAAARARIEKAVALEPDQPYWKRRLQELSPTSPAPAVSPSPSPR